MFWRCISYSGVATLVEIEGNINSARYVEILEQNSWSVVENYFSERPCHRIFHDDSSAVQDSGFMVQWKGQNSVPFWLGPSHSQDINIIENIVGERWKWSGTEERRTFSHGQLWLVLWRGSVWTALSAAHTHRGSLYHSLSNRIRHVCRANGCTTRYWLDQVSSVSLFLVIWFGSQCSRWNFHCCRLCLCAKVLALGVYRLNIVQHAAPETTEPLSRFPVLSTTLVFLAVPDSSTQLSGKMQRKRLIPSKTRGLPICKRFWFVLIIAAVNIGVLKILYFDAWCSKYLCRMAACSANHRPTIIS